MSSSNLIEINELHVRMGEQTILNGVSLHVPSGAS